MNWAKTKSPAESISYSEEDVKALCKKLLNDKHLFREKFEFPYKDQLMFDEWFKLNKKK